MNGELGLCESRAFGDMRSTNLRAKIVFGRPLSVVGLSPESGFWITETVQGGLDWEDQRSW